MPVLMIAGLVSLVLGIILFFVWFGHILALIKAMLPLGFIVGGAVASYLGWEEMKEGRGPAMDFSSPDEANRYKAEAKAYQAALNEIKSGPDEEIIEVKASPLVEAAGEPAAPEAAEPKAGADEAEPENK